MAASQGKKSRNWCFTIFPKEDVDLPWDPDCFDWYAAPSFITGIVCGLEQSKEGRIHWQGVIRFKNPVTLANAKKNLGDATAHLEPARGTWQQACDYCLKNDSGITYEDDPSEKIVFFFPSKDDALVTLDSGKEERIDHHAVALTMATVGEALDYLTEHCARDVLLYGPTIRGNLERVYEARSMEPRTPKSYTRGFFTGQLDVRSLFLSGNPGTGKTEFALDHFKFPLLIRHTEDLKRLGPKHDGLVFDDLSFRLWSPQNVIHLMDLAHASTINVKHGSVTIPAGFPRIFTCNRTFEEWIPESCNEMEKEAIRRRVIVLIVHNPLFPFKLNE